MVAAFPGTPPAWVGALIPLFAPLLSMPGVAAFAKGRLARVMAIRSKNDVSWAHARVEWADGSSREGWLRAGEAYAFLAKAAAGVAVRLARQEGRPGVFTPGALFGAELAEEAGGEFSVD